MYVHVSRLTAMNVVILCHHPAGTLLREGNAQRGGLEPPTCRGLVWGLNGISAATPEVKRTFLQLPQSPWLRRKGTGSAPWSPHSQPRAVHPTQPLAFPSFSLLFPRFFLCFCPEPFSTRCGAVVRVGHAHRTPSSGPLVSLLGMCR